MGVVVDACSAGGFPHHIDKLREHVADDAGARTTQTGVESPGPPVRDQDTHVSPAQGTVSATAAQTARTIPARPTTAAAASPAPTATPATSQQHQQRQQPPEAEMTPTTIPTTTPTPPLTSAPPLELPAVPPTPAVARGQATERASSATRVEARNGGLFRSEYPEHPDAQQVVRQIVNEMCQALGHDADTRRKQYNEYLL